MPLDAAAREVLLRLASHAIETGLAREAQEPPAEDHVSPALRAERSSFVTITIEGRLRGCCGTLEARRPLATDVWHNARASAFGDPRFTPLGSAEWAMADLEVAVLSPLERIHATSEPELRRQLRPSVDGLVLAWRGTRATFLPKVWEQVRDTDEFLRHLKLKAGWASGFWAADVEAWRYTTEVTSASRRARAAWSRR